MLILEIILQIILQNPKCQVLFVCTCDCKDEHTCTHLHTHMYIHECIYMHAHIVTMKPVQ